MTPKPEYVNLFGKRDYVFKGCAIGMDERSRKYFNKAESELSEYERMMLDIMAANEPAEEAPAPAEQVPAEEAPAEEAPVEEAPVEEAPVEEAPVEEAPVEETPAEEAPAEEAPAEEAPAEEAPVEEAPVEEAPVEEAPVEEAPVEEAPAAPPPVEETDDSDVKIAGEAPAEKKAERIPLLVEEKNPELEPVVVNRPTIQFMNSIEREKKITRKVKRHRRRSGIVVLGLCVALILVAVLYKGFILKEPILEKAEPTPEPTPVPVEVTPTPRPTPPPTPEPTPEHRYVIEKANISWVGAQDRCLSNGGYLAVINTRDEFNKITALADEMGVEFLWIGSRRDVASNSFVWERGETVDSGVDPNDRRMPLWALGEPSFIDEVGTEENYLILWNHDGGWRYWDSIGDLSNIWGWRGRIAYVCEFDS